MAAKIIDGKIFSAQIRQEVKEEIKFMAKTDRKVSLAVILVGNDSASCTYVRNKKKVCDEVGIRFLLYELPSDIAQEELLIRIKELNQKEDIDGILVQLPLPTHISEKRVLEAVSPRKDVDGLHPINAGALYIGEKGFVPGTPAGIIELLKRSGIEIEGKECVVVGRSNQVGKPMAQLLLQENGTVTTAHSHTRNLKDICRRADILIIAIGQKQMITADYVKPGAVVIDVGIHRDENNRIVGDVDFSSVSKIAGAITPVPGGVGPMTIAMLMRNCVESRKMS